MQIDTTIIHLAYMLASVLFIFGLKRMSRIKTSRQGNQMAAVAMLVSEDASYVTGTVVHVNGGVLMA